MNWANKRRLVELGVEVIDSGLRVSDGNEHALVDLVNGEIVEVRFSDGIEDWRVSRDEAKTVKVGAGNTARTVRHFLFPGSPASRLRLGQTFHDGEGSWSSLPHDFELNREKGFEEFFQYHLSGASSIAYQVGRGIWHDGEEVDSIWKVRDGDFSTIPMGYHPVVGEPGVRVSYVWAYLVKFSHWEKI